ncbi:phage terminase small subunit [Acinetobacter rathckeae]|uniref:phage terminase small subunit n=1 Tax=Acinetobacter rathckeae TaxID=2605272 RepID=UPI0018A2DF6A|nr:phage terminase small subunit [Acinetobacter rathckeae]MBF7687751.1 terminase [Acinetobacter rathckeae]MBF7688026.1 terminase [Acinetobacter rathckeae]
MNLARQHYQKHSAKEEAAQASEFGSMKNATAYQQLQMQLKSDQARLSQVQSTSRKVMLKQDLIENYMPYVNGILEAKPAVDDEIVSRMLIWSIDIADYQKALEIGHYMLTAKLSLPDSFSRKTATFMTEQIADDFLKELKNGSEVDITVLHQLEQLINDENIDINERDMPEVVKAKLYLALGKASLALVTADTEQDLGFANDAKRYLDIAIGLDDKCRGKTDLNNATKLIEQITQNMATSPVA